MKNLFRLVYIGFAWLLLIMGGSSCTSSEGEHVWQSYDLLAGYTDSLIQANPDSVLTMLDTYEKLNSLLGAPEAFKEALLELKLAAHETAGNLDSINFVIQELANLHLWAGDTLLLVDLLQRAVREDVTYGLMMKNLLQVTDAYLQRHSIINPDALLIEKHLANVLIGDNDFVAARQVLERIIQHSHQLNGPNQDISIYLSFGELYFKQGLFEPAKANYQKALPAVEGIPEKSGAYLQVLNNLGIVYRELGQLDSALYYYGRIQDVLVIPEDNIINWLKNTLNIANIFVLQGNYDKAIRQYEWVIETSTDQQIGIGVIYGKMNLANAWVSQGYAAKAIELILAVEAELEAQGSPELAYRFKYLLEEAYLASGQFRTAYELARQVRLYEDSVQTASNQTLVRNLEYFYKNDRQRLQNRLLQVRQIQRGNWLKVLFVLLLSLLFAGFIGYKGYINQKQFVKNYKAAISEKEGYLKAKSLAIQETERLKGQLLAEEQQKTRDLSRQIELLREELSSRGVNLSVDNYDDFWLNFSLSFQLIFPRFEEQLRNKYPELTPSEIQYCKLIRLNIPEQTIANIFNITLKSVYMKRRRVLIKIGLPIDEGQNLAEYFPA